MKKLLALLLVFLMLVTTVVGCSETKKDDSGKTSSTEDVADNSELDEGDEPEDEGDEPEDEGDEPEDEGDEPEDEGDEPEDEDYGDEGDEPEYEYPEEEDNTPSLPLTPEEQRLETMLLGQDAKLNEDAIYNEGNLNRLAKAIKKSQSGKQVTIVCFGNGVNTGLVTDSTYADTPYTQLLEEWWNENIGPCDVIGTGLENLTSINACLRVDFDVLQYKPDVVMLDFAAQDGISGMASTNAIGFDNLVRRILQSKTSPAVITLLLTGAEQTSYTMNAKNAGMFITASKQQKAISKYYNIPVIDFEESMWDNFTEVVKVTTKKEIPLITWSDISFDNLSMNNKGHQILAGTIKNFINLTVKKLNKISTSNYKYPTESYYGVDKYMNGSFVTVGDIIEDEATQDKGFKFDLTTSEMHAFDYDYAPRTGSTTNSLRPSIKTWRHYISENPEDETDKYYEENPHYLTLSVPKVTNSESYFMCMTTTEFSNSRVPTSSKMYAYAPATLVCYNENGEKISSLKVQNSNYSESITTGKTSVVRLPIGTTKIEFKIYCKQGNISLLGYGEFK